MATPDQLNSLDYFYFGQPYTGQTNSSIDLNSLDYFYFGQPFIEDQAREFTQSSIATSTDTALRGQFATTTAKVSSCTDSPYKHLAAAGARLASSTSTAAHSLATTISRLSSISSTALRGVFAVVIAHLASCTDVAYKQLALLRSFISSNTNTALNGVKNITIRRLSSISSTGLRGVFQATISHLSSSSSTALRGTFHIVKVALLSSCTAVAFVITAAGASITAISTSICNAYVGAKHIAIARKASSTSTGLRGVFSATCRRLSSSSNTALRGVFHIVKGALFSSCTAVALSIQVSGAVIRAISTSICTAYVGAKSITATRRSSSSNTALRGAFSVHISRLASSTCTAFHRLGQFLSKLSSSTCTGFLGVKNVAARRLSSSTDTAFKSLAVSIRRLSNISDVAYLGAKHIVVGAHRSVCSGIATSVRACGLSRISSSTSSAFVIIVRALVRFSTSTSVALRGTFNVTARRRSTSGSSSLVRKAVTKLRLLSVSVAHAFSRVQIALTLMLDRLYLYNVRFRDWTCKVVRDWIYRVNK